MVLTLTSNVLMKHWELHNLKMVFPAEGRFSECVAYTILGMSVSDSLIEIRFVQKGRRYRPSRRVLAIKTALVGVSHRPKTRNIKIPVDSGDLDLCDICCLFGRPHRGSL